MTLRLFHRVNLFEIQFSAEKAIQQRRQRAYDVEQAQRRAADFYSNGLVTTLQVRSATGDVSSTCA